MLRLFLRILASILAFLGAAATSAYPVTFTGLDKTHPDYAKWLWQNCVTTAKGGDSAAFFQQCLVDAKHFAKVAVAGDKSAGYQVVIEERQTLLLLPQVQSERNGGVKYGLFLLDSHLFGRGILGVLGASKGRYTESAFVFLNHKRRTYPFVVYGGYSKDELYLFDGEREVDGLLETRRIGRVMLGSRGGSHLTSYLALRTENRSYGAIEGRETEFAPAHDSQLHQVGGDISYNAQNYFLFFDKGLRARVQSYSAIFQQGSGEPLGAKKPKRKLSTIELDFNYGLRAFADHALTFTGFAGVADGGFTTDSLRRGGRVGFRGVPANGIWADAYATLAVDYHVPLWQAGFGTVTAAPFVDRGIAANRLRQLKPDGKSFETRKVDILSYGIGGYVYFNQVAVPGLGLVFGQNPAYGGNFVSFALGVSN